MTNKERFYQILRATQRPGVENVLAALEQTNFFLSPASTVFHGNYEGGLLEHSLNVYDAAMRLRDDAIAMKPTMANAFPADHVAIAALLHDVCKADVYKAIEKWRKDANNRWESYRGYDVDYRKNPYGHGEKSCIMLLKWGLQIFDDELAAIRWHMAAWDLSDGREELANFNEARNQYPLCSLIQFADGFATSFLEETRRN